MTKVDFTIVHDLSHQASLVGMMRALYTEDEAASPVDFSSFPRNIEILIAHPVRGSIVLFQEVAVPCGYALLIPYWSNEFGGTLLFVDELFVVPASRNRGIGHSFFEFLKRARPFDAVALALEVRPGNVRAERLYESLGFSRRRNAVFTRNLA